MSALALASCAPAADILRMKLVVHADSRVWGGNEKWLCMAAAGLAARGHQVIVSCRAGSPVEEAVRARGVAVTHARPGGDADLVRALRFRAMLRREQPDVLLLTAFKRSFWGGWAARSAGVPRVVERMGIDRPLPDRWKYRRAFRRYIDALIVNSAVIRNTWLESAPWFPADEVHVVLNGVTIPDQHVSTLRSELGISPEVPLFAAAGWLEKRKGVDTLLDAFASLPGADAQLVIAGTGPDEAQLRAQADALGVSDRVRWLGYRADLMNVLLGVDVFVLSSRSEGMANVLLEAMAAARLVIATDISGVREALAASAQRASGGWIVPPDDAAAMTRAMDEALEVRDTAEGVRRRAEARYRAEHWFSPERMIRETEAALIGKHGVGPRS